MVFKEGKMGFNEFMAKVRHWDNQSVKWMMRHFYILFFEIVLVLIFLALFVNAIKVIDLSVDVTKDNIFENLMLTQSFSLLLLVFLLLMNSFWMLYMFNAIIRIRTNLRDINFTLTRRRGAPPSGNDS